MLEHGGYLIALLAAIGCLLVVDRRFHLAWWYDWRRSGKTLMAAMAVFIVWDAAGIMLHIFFVGSSHFLTGLRLGHEFPVEEMFFLYLLTYTTLLGHRAIGTLWPRI